MCAVSCTNTACPAHQRQHNPAGELPVQILAQSTHSLLQPCAESMYVLASTTQHIMHTVTPPALASNQGMRSCQIEPPRKAALGCGHSTQRRRKACAHTRGHTHTHTSTSGSGAVLCWHAGRKVAINLCGQVTLCADEIQGGKGNTMQS